MDGRFALSYADGFDEYRVEAGRFAEDDGGYSAGYYGYLWAEVLDKDAYEAFRETGELFNKKVAARFREEILSKGGTEDGMVLYENFRGRQPSRLPLLVSRGLVEEPAANGAE